MKKTFIELRNRHIVALMRRLIDDASQSGLQMTVDELIDEVLVARPPVHYIDYDYARNMLHRLRCGGPDVISGRRLSLRRWFDLDAKVREVMATRRLKNVNSALSYVLNFCPPPSFYVSERVVRELYHRHICSCMAA